MTNPHLERVRAICSALPGTTEKISHGEPTFFAGKKVYVMFANNHHGDGHIAVWLPAGGGVQEMLIEAAPKKFFKPPYVGVRGWIGLELPRVSDKELAAHIHEAWRMVAPKKLVEAHSGENADAETKPTPKKRTASAHNRSK